MKGFVPTSDGFTLTATSGSVNAPLPNLPSHGAVVRLKAMGDYAGYCRFGGSGIVASSTDGILLDKTDGVQLIAVPTGATHIALWGGSFSAYLNITVGYMA